MDEHDSNPYQSPSVISTATDRAAPDLTKVSGWFNLLFSPRGRSGRTTYWISQLFALVMFVFLPVEQESTDIESDSFGDLLAIVLVLVFVLAFWSMIVIQIKRWHDLDKSGYWFLINFLPLGGLIACGMQGFGRGTVGPNRFGPDPRESLKAIAEPEASH
jgi:uncharacterized membrane protein YhaH (DUF805 family)